MTDHATTIQNLKQKVAQFIQERDWKQFHNPKNLSMNLACEAAELMELFVWSPEATSLKTFTDKQIDIEHEIADIFFNLLALCDHTNTDLTIIFERKIKIIEQKYPIEKAHGKALKYTEF